MSIELISLSRSNTGALLLMVSTTSRVCLDEDRHDFPFVANLLINRLGFLVKPRIKKGFKDLPLSRNS